MTVHNLRTDAGQVISEAELAEHLRSDIDGAFGLLFEQYCTPIYNYCFRRTASWDAAEELTSTVFFEAWRGRKRLVVQDGSYLPWLYGIATNVCRHYHRSAFRRKQAMRRLPAEPDLPDPADDVAGRLDDERRMAEVLAELAKLPPGERDVVVLVCWEELDYRSVATALAIPVGTVRSRLNRARRRLSAVLTAPHIQETS